MSEQGWREFLAAEGVDDWRGGTSHLRGRFRRQHRAPVAG
jgi:hypothetical protein